jgi:hypothetical protein
VGAVASRIMMGNMVDTFGPRYGFSFLLLLTAPAVYCISLVQSECWAVFAVHALRALLVGCSVVVGWHRAMAPCSLLTRLRLCLPPALLPIQPPPPKHTHTRARNRRHGLHHRAPVHRLLPGGLRVLPVLVHGHVQHQDRGLGQRHRGRLGQHGRRRHALPHAAHLEGHLQQPAQL